MIDKDIELIVSYLATNRRSFGDMFLSAQLNLKIPLEERYRFEAITRSADDRQAYREVLRFSAAQGDLLCEMVRLIIIRKICNSKLLLLLNLHKSPLLRLLSSVELQSVTNAFAGMAHPMPATIGPQDCLKWIGKVMIDGEAKGFGVLVGARSFLTCCHMLKTMFTYNAHGSYVPKKDPPQLEILFDYHPIIEDGKDKISRPRLVKADVSWLEFFSSCHDGENGAVPPACNELDSHLDYVLIRLAEEADKERSWAKLDDRAIVPAAGSTIRTFQHSNGYGQHHVESKIMEGDCSSCRFYYVCHTDQQLPGHSCWGDDFSLVGLQQGYQVLENGCKMWRGVPTVRIAEDIDRQREALSLNKHSLVLFTDFYMYQPVIGIDDFQYLIFKNIQSQKGHILTIQGEQKSGKSYCIQALYALLDSADHLKIHLSGEVISQMTAVTLARYICQVAGGELDIPALAENDSETAYWSSNDLMEKVLAVLQASRQKKMVWICICNLNIYDIEDRDASELLLLLYECVIQHSWLQFVLDDPKKELPANLAAASQRYKLREKSLEDLELYIKRFLLKLNIKPCEEVALSFAKYLYEQYEKERKKNEAHALTRLNAACRNLLNEFLNAISNKNYNERGY